MAWRSLEPGGGSEGGVPEGGGEGEGGGEEEGAAASGLWEKQRNHHLLLW